MFALANRSSVLMEELFGLIRDALRPDLALHDVSLVFELVAAIKFADPARTAELRHRYLALILDGMRATDRGELPGPPPAGRSSANAGTPASRAGYGPRGALAPFALVHGLHPGDGDRPPLLHQVGRQRLRRGQLTRPRLMPGEQPRHAAHRKVSGHHGIKVVPADRERDRRPGPHPRAVRRRHGRAVGPGRVQEHLALPVLHDECRGGQVRIEGGQARAAMARVAVAASSLLASTGT